MKRYRWTAVNSAMALAVVGLLVLNVLLKDPSSSAASPSAEPSTPATAQPATSMDAGPRGTPLAAAGGSGTPGATTASGAPAATGGVPGILVAPGGTSTANGSSAVTPAAVVTDAAKHATATTAGGTPAVRASAVGTTAPPVGDTGSVKSRLEPAQIAAAFGWVKVARSNPQQSSAKATSPKATSTGLVDAPWLSLVGTITQADGAVFYYFKNGKTGGIMQLSPGRQIGGWSLTVENSGDFAIRNESERYRIGVAR